jgi:hypothetical protein
MKNTIILFLLIFGISSCFTHKKLKTKADNLAKLDKIFQSLEFRISMDCMSVIDFPYAKINFEYEIDSIFFLNRNSFFRHYENRITQSKLDSLKNQIIQPFSKKSVKRAFQTKKITNEVNLYLSEYAIVVSNDTLTAVFSSNAYTCFEICKMLRK